LQSALFCQPLGRVGDERPGWIFVGAHGSPSGLCTTSCQKYGNFYPRVLLRTKLYCDEFFLLLLGFWQSQKPFIYRLIARSLQMPCSNEPRMPFVAHRGSRLPLWQLQLGQLKTVATATTLAEPFFLTHPLHQVDSAPLGMVSFRSTIQMFIRAIIYTTIFRPETCRRDLG